MRYMMLIMKCIFVPTSLLLNVMMPIVVITLKYFYKAKKKKRIVWNLDVSKLIEEFLII